MRDQTIATDVYVVFKQFKIKTICYTMNLHVLKFYTVCEGSEDSRSIAIRFLTIELEGYWSTTFRPLFTFTYCIGVG